MDIKIQKLEFPNYKFYRSSIFAKTFIGVLLLIGCLLALFSIYIVSIENKTLQKETENSYLNITETICDTAEHTLESLQHLMHQTIWEKSFVSAIIKPYEDDYERVSEIVTTLNQVAKGSPYILDAYLYIPTTDMVYTSEQAYIERSLINDEFFDDVTDIMEFSGTKLDKDTDSLFVYNINDRLFLCKYLYPHYYSPIGILIFEVDAESLNLITNENNSSKVCYVYDGSGQAVFSKDVPTEVSDFAEGVATGKSKSGVTYIDSGEILSYYSSEKTGWVYLYFVGSGSIPLVIPIQKISYVSIIALIIGLCISFLITFQTGRPIRKLINSVSDDNQPNIEAVDEIDYLSQVYNYTTSQNRHLHEEIRSITPLVLERLFTDILNAREPESDKINETLNSLGDPIPSGTMFTVMNILLFNKAGTELKPVELNLRISDLKNLFTHNLPDDYSSYLITREDNLVVAVLMIPEKYDIDSVQSAIKRLCQSLEKIHMTEAYQVQIGCGNIYSRVGDIRSSYLDAKEIIQRKNFYGDGEESFTANNLPTYNHYFETAQRIFICVQNKQPEQAVLLMQQVTDAIREHFSAAGSMRAQYECFLDAICKNAKITPAGKANDLLADREQLSGKLLRTEDAAAMQEAVEAFCEAAITAFESKNTIRTKEYVNRICEYVDDNYSDSNLSLYMAAEQIGISQSYLSRLFKQEMHVSFVDYVNNIRIKKSMNLLKTSDLRIKDIAFQSGFNSMQNFFRIFKKLVGITPNEYRQAEIKKENC